MIHYDCDNVAFVYHWYDYVDRPPWKSWCPIIQAIATLRSVGMDRPIYVLDCSGVPKKWAHFPSRLGFEVIEWDREYAKYNPPRDGSIIASRFFDLWKFAPHINEDILVYSDCDVFWLANPLPLMMNPERVCFNGNSGYVYFDKRSSQVEEFMQIYFDYTIRAITDDEFCEHLHNVCQWRPNKRVVVEMASSAIIEERPDLYNKIGLKEHLLGSRWGAIENPNMIHCCTMKSKTKWHQYATHVILIKELYENLSKQISDMELKLFYKGYDYEELLQKQVSYYDMEFRTHFHQYRDFGEAVETYQPNSLSKASCALL